jgi:predicted nucleotidyltransferase
MLNRKTATTIIKHFIIACGKNNIIFNKVILFGSIVTGKNHEYSDIDIAIVSDQFTENSVADWNLLSPVIISNRNFSAIETHTFPTNYFEKSDPLIEEIKRTGIEIKL